MNKNDIKAFAVWARGKIIYDINKRLESFGIFEDHIGEYERHHEDEISIESREKLIKDIINKGFKEVIEEAAYIWFLRIIAFRYMETKGFVRNISGVFLRMMKTCNTSKVGFKDEILEELDLNSEEKKLYLKDYSEENIEKLYKTVFIKSCRKFSNIISFIFHDKNDYIEFLLPDELLKKDSIVERLVSTISEEDFKYGVEIIGWLYQYYMSEKKDYVFRNLKENIKITKENIPAATQLFTPKWIVQYMVENSLLRAVKPLVMDTGSINGTIDSKDFKEKWIYYLEDENDDIHEFREIGEENRILSLKDIKVIDPCMGAGHILVYAFDVLYDIYEKVGYDTKEIPRIILENNLYGLDIDNRAVQLGSFALIMKGREYNENFFKDIEERTLELNVCSIEESNEITTKTMNDLVYRKIHGEGFREDIEYLLEAFVDAKDYGSILEVKKINFKALRENLKALRNHEESMVERNAFIEKLLNLVKQGEIMSKEYDAVITNPPYMGLRGVNDKLSKYLCEKYPVSKYDMFSAYMEVCQRLAKENSFYAMITPHSWMFLTSFGALREKLLNEGTFVNMMHLGARAFEENVGTIVQNVAFVFRNRRIPSYKTRIIDLTNEENSMKKEVEYLYIKKQFSDKKSYNVDIKTIIEIPTKSIAYWVSDSVIEFFKELPTLSSITKPRQGIATSDNKRFLRSWFEVNRNGIKFDAANKEEAMASGKKWFPYNKGGDYRKWYGNNEYIINWEEDGREVKEYAAKLYKSYSRTIKNEDFFFKRGLTYTFISEDMGVRYCPNGFIFDVAGSSVFFEDNDKINVTLGFLCSKVAKMFLDILNPTYNIQVGDLKNIPIKEEMYTCPELKEKINNLVVENIEISKKEWDSFELSWEFKTHPLAQKGEKLSDAFQMWEKKRKEDFYILKKNEEMLNSIFIEVYGLEKELSKDIADKDITIRKADVSRDIKSLISYAIGCIFGRYEIEEVKSEELIVDSGLEKKYSKIKNKYFTENNILIITEDQYFENDIVSKFIGFISDLYGEENLEENLEFIADALKRRPKEEARQTIRRYFLKDFYKEHLKTYDKKPIYWMFDSGKNNGFKALIYIHRYDENLVSRIKEEYLDVILKKYEEERNEFSLMIDKDTCSTKDLSLTKKKIDRISSQIEELKCYDNVVSYFSMKNIVVDLDDGIKSNYEKFQGINIITPNGKAVKMNLLSKI